MMQMFVRRSIAWSAFAVIAAIVAPAARAIDFGWDPLPDGGFEYVIQVEPELIETFQDQGFSSDLPASLRDVRRIRIVVGTEKLPNQGDLVGPLPPVEPPPSTLANDAGKTFSNETPAPPAMQEVEQAPQLLNPNVRDVQAGGVAPTQAPSLDPDEGPAETDSPLRTVAKPENQLAAANGNANSDSEPGKPWPLLMVVVLVLFLSLGANFYLAWIHQALRSRYQAAITGGPRALPGV